MGQIAHTHCHTGNQSCYVSISCASSLCQAGPTPPANRPGPLPGPDMQSCGGQMHICGLPPTARRQRGACPDSSAPTWRGLSGRAPSWCREHIRAPSWCGLLAERRRGAAFSAEPRRGAAQTIQRQRGATSVAAHHRGAAHVHVCRRGAVFGARRRRGTAQTALCLRGTTSVAKRHRGAANVHVRHRGAILRAEHHCGAAQTALRRRGASSVTWHHRRAVNVHVRVVTQPSGQSATVALPKRSSCASLAMVCPPGQYLRHHGGVCTWRSATLRDTPCRGDESSAVLTASRAIGERCRLARAPSRCHFLGHVPSRCTYHRARRLGPAFAAGRPR